jgi:hypothetical protein
MRELRNLIVVGLLASGIHAQVSVESVSSVEETSPAYHGDSWWHRLQGDHQDMTTAYQMCVAKNEFASKYACSLGHVELHDRHPLARKRAFTFPSTGSITALDAGDEHIYAASATEITKVLRRTMETVWVLDLASHNLLGVTAMRVAGPTIFFAATRQYSGSNHSLVLSSVSNDMVMGTDIFLFDTDDNVPYALEADSQFLYAGQYTYPGRVLKISMDTLKLEKRLVLEQGVNDIRQLEVDITDPYDQYIFANTNTKPGIILKIDKTNMTVVNKLELDAGEDYALAGLVPDLHHLFIGTNTAPARIIQVDKNTMQRVNALTLVEGQNNIAAMTADAQYLFAALYTKPGKIVRIKKQTLSTVETITLETGEDYLTTLTHGLSHLYASTYTNPAKIIEVFGYERPTDCKLGPYSDWSAPTHDCGGSQTRRAEIIQEAAFGGTACDVNATQQSRKYFATWCGLKCTGGKIFNKWANPCLRTCRNPFPTCVHDTDTVAACECPADKPLEYKGVCTSAGWCPEAHMKECRRMTCRYDDGRIEVTHHHLETGTQHYCRHSHNLLGIRTGCHCLCFHDQLSAPETMDPSNPLSALQQQAYEHFTQANAAASSIALGGDGTQHITANLTQTQTANHTFLHSQTLTPAPTPLWAGRSNLSHEQWASIASTHDTTNIV